MSESEQIVDSCVVHAASCPCADELTELGNLDISAVMAMAISYNWLFLWDLVHSINEGFLK